MISPKLFVKKILSIISKKLKRILLVHKIIKNGSKIWTRIQFLNKNVFF